MKKIPIEREKSDARISSSEREEARLKVKILFLHGFFASGQCQPALALRKAFEGRAEVVSPDLPTHVIHFDRKDTKSNRCIPIYILVTSCFLFLIRYYYLSSSKSSFILWMNASASGVRSSTKALSQ